MLIKDITLEELEIAVAKTAAEFDGNIVAVDIREAYVRKDGRKDYRLSLRTLDHKRPGASRTAEIGWRKARRTRSACWHAHGIFFDLLPERSIAVVGSLETGKKIKIQNGQNNWQDWEIGNPYMGYEFASDLCNCHEHPVYLRLRLYDKPTYA